ncbi:MULTISPECIES: succinate dehydrogenase, cytochrome b556 subunit [unclassified Marinobacterium]|uniref:succinate dehydrogenase, cytochrome b556 subunit n=1 Tax=unclassified Marinobacterium TaxID=2644139 RepID=UPI00156A5923|nr:Succinate dehydrogenase cytochrome b556 subunit [Marinobacterium sp. xm-g-48]NRP15783.1 Succinate dehydrogenase cytochrome b556 subunit [Marinobacterium sp. xm-a-152]NRP27592.1 Succinate dehydrogenase cytochrome b556 subunit [Marinobacterium sp. xm-d-420]NRP36042.1 Succinate dehydrogenase cytochrome b556 subunit [Marinobacterium sp. xm-d-579]NRP38823.1 Succinate dehydrogenase cytochrome b556 subunit [Marinobacterium sp. xm-a-121]NRP47869.1 Succinate dehydrogenase cytochrome b556 subunit [Ma
MNKKRPVNLDLRTIKQPLPAVTSILHRVTGLILFVGTIFMMYALSLSLESQEGFDAAAALLTESFIAKFIAWGLLSALLYHFFAGIKHLVMDAGYCEEIESGNAAAKATLAISAISIVLAGVWVW